MFLINIKRTNKEEKVRSKKTKKEKDNKEIMEYYCNNNYSLNIYTVDLGLGSLVYSRNLGAQIFFVPLICIQHVMIKKNWER